MTSTAAETRSVVVEREIPFPPGKIWRALTQPHLMQEWLMRIDDFKPEVGNGFRLSGDWGGVDCEVQAVEPDKSLSYTWNYAHEDPAYALESVVTFTLTQTPSGTHLRVEQTGFRPDQKQALGGALFGWTQNLETLEKVVAQEG